MTVTPLLIVLHNHQPVGNFPWVVEECYSSAYAPFLDVLERHPGVRLGLHFTGALLDWLEREQPDYLARVRLLVAAGQVEVLGGGLYEPILSVIPERDRRGQLLRLRERVTRLFGAEPTGAWLAERVWEPSLPTALHAAGIDYVLVDDEVFRLAGYPEVYTSTTFLTEDQGARVRLAPISRRLRYTLPTKPVEDVLATLRAMAAEGAEVLIYAEDGERYGHWPGTAGYLFGEEAYLERLFSALEAADDLVCQLPGEYVRQMPPRELIYLPPTSYTEMLRWSGGFWRNFLTRYRESNLMHKKMYQVSRWVAQAEDAGEDVREMQTDLYAAQCNCAYWYGAFGGLFLPSLRRAVYAHLLRAERAVALLLPPEARPACELIDHDCDGHEEILLRAGEQSVGIAPARGGAVFALEELTTPHNFLDVMGRYPSPASAEPDAAETPTDWYPRLCFLDHFLPADATPQQMRDAQYHELGDAVLGAYTVIAAAPGIARLRREAHYWDGPDFVPVQVDKCYTFDEERLQVTYTLANKSARERIFRFASEINVCLSAGDAPGRTLMAHTSTAAIAASFQEDREIARAERVCYRDDWLGNAVTVAWSHAARLWIFPISTALRTLEGLEWVYQSTVTLPMWEIALPPAASWSVTLTMEVAVATRMASLAGN